MADTHAPLSPSAAHRWLVCPGSVRAQEGAPDRPSPEAAAGTRLHAELARLLTKQEVVGEPSHLVDLAAAEVTGFLTGYGFNPDKHTPLVEQRMEVTAGMRLLLGAAGGVLLPEGHLDGTCDILWYDAKRKVAVVLDAKFGFDTVSSLRNPQLMLYAAGAAVRYPKAKHFVMGIVQPKNEMQPLDYEVVSRDVLADRLEAMLPNIQATMSPNAPRVASEEGCRYCRVRDDCAERARHALELARRDLDDEELASFLPLVQVVELARRAPLIRRLLDDVEARLKRGMEAGMKVPGFKLVRARKHRAWARPEAEVIESLSLLGYDLDALAPRKLLSPAQVEKLVGGKAKRAVGDLTAVPEGGLVVAPEDDPREAVKGHFDDMALAEEVQAEEALLAVARGGVAQGGFWAGLNEALNEKGGEEP